MEEVQAMNKGRGLRRVSDVVVALLVALVLPLPAASAAPGDLDPTFGQGGKMTTDLFGGASDVAIQADGKIVVAGGVTGPGVLGGQDFALIRFHPDGTVDGSFGNNGIVATDFGTSCDCAADLAWAIAIQTDNRIIAAGRGGAGLDEGFALARYHPNGALDSSFGEDGKVITNFGYNWEVVKDVVIQSDGKIVAAGVASTDFALARYHAYGGLDRSFSSDGLVTTRFPLLGARMMGAEAEAVVLQDDGKIVVAGTVDGDTGADFALARYHSSGAADLDFGALGLMMTDFNRTTDRGYTVALQDDQDGAKIVVGGVSGGDFALARYKPNGMLDDGMFDDAGFGTGGKVTTDMGADHDYGMGLAIQSDGGIVTAGGVGGDFALAHYHPTGTLNTGVGTAGRVTTDFGGSEGAHAVITQADGKIIVAGWRSIGNDGDVALARHLNDDRPDILAPETTITSGPSGSTTDNTPTFEFTSNEAGSSFECHLDTAAFAPCTSPYTTPPLASGSHSFEVRAIDAAGNSDASPATRSFTVEVPERSALSIGDASAAEGNGKNKTWSFTVRLSEASSESITVRWTTADGTALAPEDYTTASDGLTFSPGEVSKIITVSVNGDRKKESNETFYVNLSSPINATIADNQGIGTIVNDD